MPTIDRHEHTEVDAEKASREESSQAQLAELIYADPKAESRYVITATLFTALMVTQTGEAD